MGLFSLLKSQHSSTELMKFGVVARVVGRAGVPRDFFIFYVLRTVCEVFSVERNVPSSVLLPHGGRMKMLPNNGRLKERKRSAGPNTFGGVDQLGSDSGSGRACRNDFSVYIFVFVTRL